MADEITRVIEKDSKRVGVAVVHGVENGVSRFAKQTEKNMVESVEAHARTDVEHTRNLERAGRHGDETPSTHTGGGEPPRPVSDGGGGTTVPATPTVAGGGKRDANGNLHDERGRFSGEPGKTQDYVDRATKGTKRPRTLDDRGDFDRTLAARTDAANSKAAAGREIDDIAKRNGVDPAALKSTNPEQALRDLQARNASRADIAAAKRANSQYQQSLREQSRNSEKLGVQAGEDVLKQDGYQQISGSSARAGRPGEADLIGVSPDGQSIKVIEAKGGTAGLGDGRYLPDHNPPGRAEQGSSAYLDDVLKRDPGFQQALQSNPALKQAYESGTLKIDYTLVSASPTGRVSETPLVSR